MLKLHGIDFAKSAARDTESKLISINAALAERAERLRGIDEAALDVWSDSGTARLRLERDALNTQIRDLENEKHALLQELPL